MSDEEKLYSTKQAAKFLGVDRKTIQRWRKARVLTPDLFGENNMVLYTEKRLVKVATSIFSTKRASCDISAETAQTGQKVQQKVGNRLPVPQTLVTRLLHSGSR